MVLAGPGSGKTTVITSRIQNLVSARGVDPSKILVITFTRAAADEMKLRYERLTDGKGGQVTFGTFHSVFFFILRHAYGYRTSQIVRADQKREFIRQMLRDEGSETDDEAELIGSVLSEISRVKGEGLDVSSFTSSCCEDELFLRLYQGYQEQLKRQRLIDFDDMMIQCRDLFLSNDQILKKWQERFQFILIDEFQDINRMQYDIMRLLALPENNLFIVGDDDQSIYRFRGACPKIMLDFPKDYPTAKTITLEVNYRSCTSIVEAASRLIRVNSSRFQKKIAAATEEPGEASFSLYDTVADQNEQVIRDAAKYHEEGIPYSEMAILFRTNHDPRAMVEKLVRMNFPFYMKDVVPNLYEHWVAQDVLTYMILAAGSRKRGDFLRIINRPKRYIRRADLSAPTIDLAEYARQCQEKPWIAERVRRLMLDLERLSCMDPYAAVNYIRKGIGYDDFLLEYAELHRIRSDELIEVLDEVQEAAKPFRTLGDWLAHIRSYTRELQDKRKDQEQEDGILITTMHGSKGLEFQVVFIVDANEGVTPHRKAQLPEEIEEERRLFYVAMTRAKRHLHIASVRQWCGKNVPVSRFVEEAGKRVRNETWKSRYKP